MPGILSGGKRHAQPVVDVRGNAMAAKAPRLNARVSDDQVRRALKAMTPEVKEPSMRTASMASVAGR